MSEEIEYKPQITFETIKKTNTHGQDCWSARELGKILGYAEFRNFLPVIDKAKEACQNSGYAISDHFVDSHEMVDIGSGARTSALYKKNSVAWICDPGS